MNRMRESQAVMIAALAACLPLAAHGSDASPWIDDTISSLRLIAGGTAVDGSLHAGVEIKLKPGWHTYWRYPGDSGVPPRFAFAGSDNVSAVKVLYPAPRAFSDETGTTIGYMDTIIFPLRVSPRQKGKPATLHVQVDYAVCEKLCVPVTAKTDLTLPGDSPDTEKVLAAAEAQVPKMESAAVVGLKAYRVNGKTPKPMVFVDLAAPAGEKIALFVEGPTPEWALPIPSPAPGAPAGHQYFGFALDGLPPGVDPKGPFELTFTIVRKGMVPVETRTRLDE
jgi:DsbC/DsbD-like thiol-disulfide interchange protein